MSTTCIVDALIIPIIDEVLQCTAENIYGKYDQAKDSTSCATTITDVEKNISVGITSNNNTGQVTAQDKPVDMNVSLENNMNELGTLKKESVHFCSPIASYHEYYISQDSCTQPLSDADESDLSVTPNIIENGNEGFESKYNCQSKQGYAEGNQANLMTPAGDCSNSLLVGRIFEESKDHEITEVQRRLVSKNNTAENNNQSDFVDDASNKAEEDVMETKDDNFETGLMKCGTNSLLEEEEELIANSTEKCSSCSNSSPDLFDTNTNVSCNDSILPKYPNSQTLLESSYQIENIASSNNIEEMMTEKIYEETDAPKDENETAQSIKADLTDIADTAAGECLPDKTPVQLYMQEIDFNQRPNLKLDVTSNPEELVENSLSDTILNSKNVGCIEMSDENDGSQDLFPNIKSGNRSDSGAVKNMSDSDEKNNEQVRLSQDMLYCNESFDNEACGDSSSNKNKLSSPHLYSQPSKKQKIANEIDTDQNRAPKRMVPFPENNEEITPLKKLRFSDHVSYQNDEEDSMFNPEALKSLAAGKLNCLKEDVLSRRIIGKKNKNTELAVQFDATCDLNNVNKQKDTLNENTSKSVNQMASAEEFTLQDKNMRVDTKETSKHTSNGDKSETNKLEDNTMTKEMEEFETKKDIDGANNFTESNYNRVNIPNTNNRELEHGNVENDVVLSDTLNEQTDVKRIKHQDLNINSLTTGEKQLCFKITDDVADKDVPDLQKNILEVNTTKNVNQSTNGEEFLLEEDHMSVVTHETGKYNTNGDKTETNKLEDNTKTNGIGEAQINIEGANKHTESNDNRVNIPNTNNRELDHGIAGNDVFLSDTLNEQMDIKRLKHQDLNINSHISEEKQLCFKITDDEPDLQKNILDENTTKIVNQSTNVEEFLLEDVDNHETCEHNSNGDKTETYKRDDRTMSNEMEEAQTDIDGANYCIESDHIGVDNPKPDEGQIDHENAVNGVVLSDTVNEQVDVKRLKPQDFSISSGTTEAKQMCLKITDDVAEIYEPDLCELKFISGTEYLSQSSHGSSTGFTYEKNNSPEYLCDSQEFRSLPEDTQLVVGEDLKDLYKEEDGPCETSHPTTVMVELAAETCTETEIDMETLDMMVSSAVDHLVPDDEISAEENTTNSEDCSMFEKGEEVKSRYYSCDVDMCDEEDKPVCPPVDKRADGELPSSSSGCFKWKYAPSCDTDRPVSEVDMEETIVKITPMHTCNKPLRLGLSRKRQPLHRLHKF